MCEIHQTGEIVSQCLIKHILDILMVVTTMITRCYDSFLESMRQKLAEPRHSKRI